jgi:hypothetical protein
MALVFVLMGLIGTLPCLMGYSLSSVRNIEDILPDHETLQEATEEDPVE